MQLKKWNLVLGSAIALLCAQAATAWSADVLPKTPEPFKGTVDVSRDKSTPEWPKEVKAPQGAPNIVLVLLDDVGFGASSAVGGAVDTPALDKLASGGLRYNSFHVNAMCSPTRGALLSGRNNHQVGFGPITEQAAGYPGYNSIWPKNSASIAEVLKQNGYSTAAFGKWHNTPVWEVSPAGPFERWPTGLGFEYFYGFLGASTSQWEPNLYRGTVAVEPPAKPEQGYNLTNDLANDAIRWLHQHDAVAPDKPFFLYFATAGTHSPHHVPQEWVDKFKGKFDQGWDKLRAEIYEREKKLGVIPANAANAPRPAQIPAWDSLTEDQRKLVTRQQEVYAGFLAQTDHEVGRVLEAVKALGKFDNTLVLYIVGDNGATMEGNLYGADARTPQGTPEDVSVQLARSDKLGTPALNNNYAAGWAYALNAPFPWAKQRASHLGGITDPLIVSWPARIKDNGGIRAQFSHVIDIAPTIYEAAGIKAPDEVNGVKQSKLEGSSLLKTFNNPKAKTGHDRQYFELVGNRGVYKDGWFAGRPFLLPWESAKWEAESPDRNQWELYNLNEDFSQTRNLADKDPKKLKELVTLFDQEARRNNAYPIAPRRLQQPSPANGKTSFTYREGVARLPLRVVPGLAAQAHTITADIDVPAGGANGVIYAEGGRYGGFSLYVKEGRLVYENNSRGLVHEKLVSTESLPAGKVKVVFEFTPDLAKAGTKDVTPGRSITPGRGRLLVNGKPAGETAFSWFGGFGETFDVGQDLGSPVSDDYATPFAFTGKIAQVKVDLK
ncbi:arylsulfatase [Herbaspirillum sp. HC18]|nr:arylsulfatase [Herbaspirillum sp. HC18]